MPDISLYHYHKAGEVAAFIEANSPERTQLTIPALSKRFGICETLLMKTFKYRYKQTIHGYIIQKRIEKAVTMLCVDKMMIKEIRYALGYQEINHLTRDFKKILGMTPSQYRNERCGNNMIHGQETMQIGYHSQTTTVVFGQH